MEEPKQKILINKQTSLEEVLEGSADMVRIEGEAYYFLPLVFLDSNHMGYFEVLRPDDLPKTVRDVFLFIDLEDE